jgi:hypothetical protein
MQDRRCIVIDQPKNQITQRQISAWDLVSCCTACQGTQGNGCQGGYPTSAFNFFGTTGVVTGGAYANTATCKPYPVSTKLEVKYDYQFPGCSNGSISTNFYWLQPNLPSKLHRRPVRVGQEKGQRLPGLFQQQHSRHAKHLQLWIGCGYFCRL